MLSAVCLVANNLSMRVVVLKCRKDFELIGIITS